MRFVIGRALAVVPGRRDDTVHAIFRLFRSIAPRSDARVGHGGRIGQLPGFFRPVAEGVVFPQGRAIVVAALPASVCVLVSCPLAL